MPNHITKSATRSVAITETPFDKRHCCWFCGEPNNGAFVFPSNDFKTSNYENKYVILSCPHPIISIPSCGECQKIANKAQVDNIWAVNAYVKKQLLKSYSKDLAIGINWTQEELATSEFDQGNFAGFARSAWFMYEVAKARINYLAWPLVVNGIELEVIDYEAVQVAGFSFDGVQYPSLPDAIKHYARVFLLDEPYVFAVLQHLSGSDITQKSFAQAVRFCRLLVNATPSERKMAFKALVTKS
ncbi:hypothetical protein [Colwellia psychrerythraea]|uniref:Uncharacterized protein n=1 Tax=Colwellia psychrerythraea TaxID=28229 RepID=A0A099L2E5_COLPS|nr:hypothetical protein [Colwellia psychrerythraea]KGJ97104.1 hypothetical protein GAB14E_1572 [Colwellia psychrerythraea]